MLVERFYPDEYLDSTYSIDFAELAKKGYRGVLFDIDNTLVPHGAPADSRAIALFEKLHALGFQTCLLSNNKELRVKSFADQVHSPYIYKAGKPGVKNYNRAVQEMGLCKEEVLCVGDQLFTDVYGANRAGIYGILVKPINPKEEIQIVLKRYLEAVVLYFYRKHNK